MIHHVKRATLIFVFWGLIVAAAGSTVLRVFFSEIKTYKIHLEQQVSDLLEVPVKIGKLRAGFRGFNPELILTDISILPQQSDTPDIQFREIHLGINVMDIIQKQQLYAASWVTVVGAKFTLKRKTDGSLAIIGLKANDEQPLWLMLNGRYEMLDSEITWQDEMRHSPSLNIQHVNVTVNNNAENVHQLHVAMNLPEEIGVSLILAMEFTGNLFEPESLEGKLYAKADKIQLDKILHGPLLDFTIETATTDFELWSEIKNTQLISLTGTFQVQQGKIKRKDGGIFAVDNISALFRLQRQAEKWQLEVKNFAMQSGDAVWTESEASLWMQGDKQHPLQQFTASISQINLQPLCSLITFSEILNQRQTQLLKKLQAQGQITELSLFADQTNSDFAFSAKIKDLHLAAVDNVPGVENFSAYLKGTLNTGFIELTTDDAQITFPELFRSSLPVNHLKGRLNWQQFPGSWKLASDLITLDTPDIRTRNKLRLTIPKTDQPAFMDWQSFFFGGHDVSRAKLYFPTGIMDEDVVDWLDNAFVSGSIPQGRGLFYGEFYDFPFINGAGVFEVLFNTQIIELSYDPDWLPVTDLSAEVLFLRDGLQVTSNHGLINNAVIHQVDVAIPSFETSEHLLIKGTANGSITQSLDYLNQSPLQSLAMPILEVIAAEGQNKITVDLKIPLIDEVEVFIKGKAQLENAQLKVIPIDLPVSQVSGDLYFNESGVYSNNLQAEALGYPIQVDIQNKIEGTLIRVMGSSDVKNLQQQFPNPWWHLAEGAFDYQISLSLPYAEQINGSLSIKSDLYNLALDLPESLAKPPAQSKPFSAHFDFTDTAVLPVKLNYAGLLKAAIEIDKETHTATSANILYGEEDVATPVKSGVYLEVQRDKLDLDTWLELVNNDQTELSEIGGISQLKVQVSDLEWQTTKLGAIDFTAESLSDFWQCKIHTDFAAGDFKLPNELNKDSRIKFNLNFLDLTKLKKFQHNETLVNPISPVSFPLFELKSEKVLWKSENLGALELQTEREDNGIRFNTFELISADHQLSLTGRWIEQAGQVTTEVTGNLKSENLGDLLTLTEISDEMEDSRSIIKFPLLQWSGAPYQFNLAHVSGTVEANIEEGRIRSVDTGFGRLLGAIDLGQWSRRIRMDFSDWYTSGLIYDSIKADFKITEGIAQTDGLIIRALPAKIIVSGKTDLVQQTFDQIITIIPKSSAAIPIAGTIVNFVAESFTNDQQEGFFFRSQYKVKGKWGEAEVIPVPENDGLIRKVWTGIANFSLSDLEEKNEREHE